MCGRSQDEEDMQASLTETVADDGAPRRRGRKRFLPVMNNSERARYYRRKDAQELAAKKAVVRDLRRDIDSLRFQRRLHRHLIEHSIAEIPRYQIVNQVAAFVASRLEKLVPELQKCQYEIQGMEISGDPTGPVLRLECTLSGRLLPSVVRRIYPYVLGNSVALSRMMHSDMEYPCYCEFFFTPHGLLAHHIVDVDIVGGYLNLLGSLQIVGRVLADASHHSECDVPVNWLGSPFELQSEDGNAKETSAPSSPEPSKPVRASERLRALSRRRVPEKRS